MPVWTDDATRELNQHVSDLRERGASDDAVADLRRRLDEAATLGYVREVTPAHVRALLRRVDDGRAPIEAAALRVAVLRPDSATRVRNDLHAIADARDEHRRGGPRRPAVRQPGGTFGSALIILFGIGTPLLTVVLELMTRMCSDLAFDPLRTRWHAARPSDHSTRNSSPPVQGKR